MDLGPDLIEGRFIERVNRFLATVEVDGREVAVHVANSGRMKELFVPEARVFIKRARGAHRKTQFDLVLVDLGGALASADARLPNALVAEAVAAKRLEPFSGYTRIDREVTFGESRLDLKLSGPPGQCYVEAKSVTLIRGGAGLFPDSPTVRGAKHLRTLVSVVEAGHRAAVVFVVQRADAWSFSTNDIADPVLGETFRWALSAGVEGYAYRCRVTLSSVELDELLPIRPFQEAGDG